MLIDITVVYSPAPRQVHEKALLIEAGSRLAAAIEASGFSAQFPELNQHQLDVGVWGRKAPLDQALKDKDRVEIYRPLKVDPKVARRERFAKQGIKTAGLFAKRRDGAKPGY
jgi:putative ubiquitin-RnfH superfamily antitoxin RatB of RatAB toxin-antitoxin module